MHERTSKLNQLSARGHPRDASEDVSVFLAGIDVDKSADECIKWKLSLREAKQKKTHENYYI